MPFSGKLPPSVVQVETTVEVLICSQIKYLACVAVVLWGRRASRYQVHYELLKTLFVQTEREQSTPKDSA